MSLQTFIETHRLDPSKTQFEDAIAAVDTHFNFEPVAFRIGDQENEAGTNMSSCKLVAFAKLQGLSVEETLHLFGRYYREDVLEHPDAKDHQNIRNLMRYGWDAVAFDSEPLSPRA